jgi:hypothetical protein
VPVASPGARIEVGVGMSSRATRCVTVTLSQAKSIGEGAPAVSTLSPTRELVHSTSWTIACSVPSALAPRRMCCSVSLRWPHEVNICSRPSTSFTLRFVTRAPIAAMTVCGHEKPLQPKPPPRYGASTRTFASSSSKAAASAPRAP